jgi:hypothetical protein
MRLLTLPVTIARIPFELGFGAAKRAVKLAQGLVGSGEETVVEEPAARSTRRRRPARRSGNGRTRTTAAKSRTTAAKSRTSAAKRRTTAAKPRTTAAKPRTTAATRPSRGTAPAAEKPASPAPVAEPAAPRPPAPEGEPLRAQTPTPAPEESARRAPAPEAGPVRGETPTRAGDTTVPFAREPAHVSEEPEIVAEAAERGAEEGAGAEVAVDEPWPGYDDMNAPDIEDRLLAEGNETAAAVSLYEASRKGRASILEAASRSMSTPG